MTIRCGRASCSAEHPDDDEGDACGSQREPDRAGAREERGQPVGEGRQQRGERCARHVPRRDETVGDRLGRDEHAHARDRPDEAERESRSDEPAAASLPVFLCARPRKGHGRDGHDEQQHGERERDTAGQSGDPTVEGWDGGR